MLGLGTLEEEEEAEASEIWAFPAPLAEGLDGCEEGLMERKEREPQFSVFTGDLSAPLLGPESCSLCGFDS